MDRRRTYIAIALSLYIAIIFIQSLFFKFADAPDTQNIFNALDAWAGGLGYPGLFARGGIFSAVVIGSAELVASILLLAGLTARLRVLRLVGAAMALAIISGAIFFHLFTPLGVVVNDDGGLLFSLACGVWLSAAAILYMERSLAARLVGGTQRA